MHKYQITPPSPPPNLLTINDLQKFPKSLNINDLRNLPPRKSLIFNDLRNSQGIVGCLRCGNLFCNLKCFYAPKKRTTVKWCVCVFLVVLLLT